MRREADFCVQPKQTESLYCLMLSSTRKAKELCEGAYMGCLQGCIFLGGGHGQLCVVAG